MATRTDIIGSTGLERTGGDVFDEWHHRLRGKRGAREYREMRDNDATIGASLLLIQSLIRQVKWTEEPAPDSGDAGDEQAEFLRQCRNDMSHTWADFMGEVLSEIWYGWSYFEKVFKVRDGPQSQNPERRSQFDDGKVGWRMLSIRSQETLDDWQFDDDGGIRGMWQCAAPDYHRVFIPIEKSILFRTELNKNNPEGRSMLRNAWRSWYFLKRLQELEAVGIQKDMVGTPVATVPIEYLDKDADPAQKAVAQKIFNSVKKFQRNEQEGFVMPSKKYKDGSETGFDLFLLSTGGRRQLNIDGAIKRYSRDIAMVLMTQFIFLGMDKAGSFALSSDMTNIMATALGSILDSIQDTFNRFAVRELFELNGVPEELRPKLVHGDIEKEDMERFSAMLLSLTNSGAITPDSPLEDWLRARLELPDREEPTEDEEVFGVPRAPQPPPVPGNEGQDDVEDDPLEVETPVEKGRWSWLRRK